MPAASAFSATYLDAPSASLVSKNPNVRFWIAGAVYDLTRLLNDGMSAANAQAQIAGKRRHQKFLWAGASVLGASTIVTDFQAITTP
jgi:hypothetical protein